VVEGFADDVEDEVAACFEAGSRTAGGGGAAVSGVTEERALAGFENLLSVARESAQGLKF
jgi:hypothetical protein